ncbi:MAG: TlyA family RNA methyltransferase [Leptospiraceae bacterium]|nr:TlyA family RNA methyltransferase [Leptospiraceae bacterium]MCK6381100.1 TlyA family RNA methyltransferase [Leptospiraceae bacterium]NUM40535.1 TlyA family RNA methyltransferase [Leptospiraceae bacterium]
MQKEKIRLDQLLVERGFCEDIKKAESLILSGSVIIENQKVTKKGFLFPKNSKIEILEKIPRIVSRAGEKLEYALKFFQLDVSGKTCLDFGASTGGFTQVLLERGAKNIFAFDVGYGQIAGKLRNDNRVTIKDKFNVKNITEKDFSLDGNELVIVMDLSFISLLAIFPSIFKIKKNLPKVRFEIISLIKPQFECAPNLLEKGIVKKKGVHFKVIRKICNSIKKDYLGKIHGLCESPILGRKGNKEFFLYWSMDSKFTTTP